MVVDAMDHECMRPRTYVTCPQCHHERMTKHVKFVNIEEDTMGRDVMTFHCVYCQEDKQALVYAKT